MKAEIESYLARRRSLGNAAGTIRNHRANLNLAADYLACAFGAERAADVTPKMLLSYHDSLLAEELAPVTISDRLRAIAAFFRWAKKEALCLSDPSEALTLPRLRKGPPKTVLSVADVKRLLTFPDIGKPGGLRDRAVLETFYAAGLRLSELLNLDIADLDMKGETIFVREGKGGRDRVVPMGREAARWIGRYLSEARPLLAWPPSGTTALFLCASRSRGKPLTAAAVYHLFRRLNAEVGLSGRVTPHAMRHAFATHLLRGGADVVHVQRLLGHAEITTTQVYTHLAIEDLKRVHAEAHPREQMEI